MKALYIIQAITALLLISCSKEEIVPAPAQDNTLSIYNLVINISHNQYGGNTKSDYQWPDGATIYIKFPDASSTSTATYNAESASWSITTPQGSLTKNKETKCEISYFEKVPHGELITLSQDDIIYYDGEAKYLLESDTLTLTANLTPKTGRIRFKGETGTRFKLYGTSHYSIFNTEECNYYSIDEELELAVGESGYTPYIYVYFPNSAKRMEITDQNENIFIFKCSDEHLAAGASGYFDIPTESNMGSWKKYTPTKIFEIEGTDLEIKMIFVQYIQGSFYMAETETTQKVFQAIMNYNPSYFKSDTTDLPVTNIDRDGLNLFMTTIKEKTGYPFSCPYKDQWWHAARGGNKSKNFKYSGSDNMDDVAWHRNNSEMGNDYNKYYTHPVKTKLPNELGLYDMSGNVWEAYIYSTDSSGECYYNRIGGGCSMDFENYSHYVIINRSYLDTYGFSNDVNDGFRLCLNL